MTEKEYRSHPAISRSELWWLSKSPEYFRYRKDHPAEPTPALLFGQVVHKLLLEPDSFDQEFAVAPSVDRRTKDGKAQWEAFVAASDGLTVVGKDLYDQAEEMVTAARNSPYVEQLLNGEYEKVFFWTDDMTGEECKCRVDCLTYIGETPYIIDYKTTSDASVNAFMRDAIRYGYDFQSAMYGEGVAVNLGLTQRPKFVFIVQEKDPPYSVNIFEADELFVKRGYDIFREYIGIYHHCKETNDWYGFLGPTKAINVLSLPAWLAKE